MQLVSTITLTSSSTNTMQFTSIPQTGKHLLLLVSARSTTAANPINLGLYINDIFTFTYQNRRLRGDGSSATSAEQTGARPFDYPSFPGNTVLTNTFGLTDFLISNYTASGAKSLSIDSVIENSTSSAEALLIAGLLNGAGPVTKLELVDPSGGLFAAGTIASLYILK